MTSLPDALLQRCENLLQEKILEIEPISGGDINEARVIKTKDGLYFLKFNSSDQAYEMFSSESMGLNKLRSTQTIKIPDVISYGKAEQSAFLILEYIEPDTISQQSFERLGEQLAQLHKNTAPEFGLRINNFIGTLFQRNNQHQSWPKFFIYERLLPQLKSAFEKNLIDKHTMKKFEMLYLRIEQICPVEPPALIHGDLWKGNFLIEKNNTPVLFDPSISFSHREMDLAMTKLFGGFEPCFYEAYQNVFPLAPNFEERMEVYQLYYLLVHLNLFGVSYLSSIENILKRFC